jgi:dinuclear metal center YbgI/SA1388 family protein
MADLLTLERYCNEQLLVDDFNDYCPNGIQVEACVEVKRLMVGVTACQALIDKAIDWEADLLLTHHGFFWKSEAAPIRGIKGRRIGSLLRNRISLIAYHLPLDAHPEWGNNRQLGDLLGFSSSRPSEKGLIWVADLPDEPSTGQMEERLRDRLGRDALLVGAGDHAIRRVGWCTGAAQGYIEEAAEMGLDAYISGEISESTVHLARELGVHYFAAGHHATERGGVQALGRHLAQHFELDYCFCEIENPA